MSRSVGCVLGWPHMLCPSGQVAVLVTDHRSDGTAEHTYTALMSDCGDRQAHWAKGCIVSYHCLLYDLAAEALRV